MKAKLFQGELVRLVAEDSQIIAGNLSLWSRDSECGFYWNHGDAYLGVGIGERQFWGKGYGTDAICVLLRYAFLELNLQRVSLNTFAYNPRAIRSYEKAGFVVEGRCREVLKRDGRRYDLLYMGILRAQWENQNFGRS